MQKHEATALRSDILQTLQAVPDYEGYGTKDELHQCYRDMAEEAKDVPGVSVAIEPVGSYTDVYGKERPLELCEMTLGNPENGLTLYRKGEVHTNELAYRLANRFAGSVALRNPRLFQRLGYSRLLFYTAETEGVELNHWHPGRRPTFGGYFAHAAYRSGSQVDWDYSARYKDAVHTSSLPATQASEQIIKHYVPDFTIAQHNGTVGGHYMLKINTAPQLPYDIEEFMQMVRPEMPVGQTDVPFATKLAPGLYRSPTYEDQYEYYAQRLPGEDIRKYLYGENSLQHAAKIGRLAGKAHVDGLVSEAPYFAVPGFSDNTPLAGDYRAIGAAVHDRTLSVLEMNELYLDDIRHAPDDHETRLLLEGARGIGEAWRTLLAAEKDGGTDLLSETATEGDRFRLITLRNFYPVVPLSMAVRAAARVDHAASGELRAELHKQTTYLEQELRPVPLSPREMVQCQEGDLLFSLLAQAEGLAA
jgi:hypothetical protein